MSTFEEEQQEALAMKTIRDLELTDSIEPDPWRVWIVRALRNLDARIAKLERNLDD